MRLLIASQFYYPALSLGGSVGNAVSLAEGFAAKGHEVTVVTSTVVDLKSRPSRLGRTEMIRGVKVHYLGSWPTFRKMQINPGVAPLAWRRLDFDWLHVIGLYDSISPLLTQSARRARVPYSVEPAGMLTPGTRSQAVKRIYHRIVGQRILGNADFIVATSRIELEDALGAGCAHGRILIRRNGIDLAGYEALPARGNFRRRLGLAPDDPLVLFVGRVDRMKAIELLIDAVSRLAVPTHVAIVGPAEDVAYRTALQRLAEKRGLAGHLHWAGPLFREEKLSALVDADVLALVSAKENWGNVVMEAMAAGTPVVVTDTCGVAEAVRPHCGIVVQWTAQAIAIGLRHVLDQRDRRERARTPSPEIAAAVSWESPLELMEARMKERTA